jgi:hypothetical protein
MFTTPLVGFTNVSYIRPTSVIDTPGAGTITSSSYAYDADNSTLAQWFVYLPATPLTTYSVYSFTGSTVLVGKSLYIYFYTIYLNDNIGGSFYLSVDGGLTYPLSVSVPLDRGVIDKLISIAIPNGTTLSLIKVKATPTMGYSAWSLFANEIYIQ